MRGDFSERVRGIEPPCAAWEAAVLPLNYTREEIFDFRFAIADCNRNKFAFQIAVSCAACRSRSEAKAGPQRGCDRGLVQDSAEDSGDYSSRFLKHHCQEITSSAAVPAFLSPEPPAWSGPRDQPITPFGRFGVAPAFALYGLAT